MTAAARRTPAAGPASGEDRAEASFAAGRAANSQGRPGAAVRHLRAALREAGSGSAMAQLRARILISLAWAEVEREHIELGFKLLDEAEALITGSQRGIVHGQRGLLLRRTGRDQSAIGEYDTAVSLLRERSAAEDLAKVLSNRAVACLAVGRVGAARADLTRSIQIAGRHGYEVSAAVSTQNLGDLDLLRGDIPAALRCYGTAERTFQRVAPGRLADVAIDRARALLAAGLYAEADRELGRAIEHAARQGLSHAHAEALLSRAEAALIAGQPAMSGRWARQARQRFLRRANPRRADLARLLELRAEQAVTSRRRSVPAHQQADLARRASDLGQRLAGLGLHEDARVAASVAARTLGAARRLDEAVQALNRYGPATRRDRLDTRLLWRLTQAELAAAAGDTGEETRQLAAGMATLRRYRSLLGCLDLQTGASVHGADLAQRGLAAALASESVAAVFRWAELARSQALLLAPVRPPPDPEAAAALEQLRQVQHTARAADLAGRPTAGLRARAVTLKKTIREHAWSANGPGAAAELARLGQVRAALGHRAMVIYLRSGACLHALVLTRATSRLVRLGPAAAAEKAVLALRADLDAQAGRTLPARLAATLDQATRRDAGILAAVLLDPLLPYARDRDLVVVPTGLLVTVPWALLPGCGGRPVTVAPSATTWLAARERVTAQPPDGDGGVLVAAGPGNLRGRDEAEMVAALRPGAQVLTGSAATPAAVLAGLDGVGLAHIAAHGEHEPDNALFSALVLADGQLMGYDIQQVTAPGTVVLSSCDLGLADVRPGDETLGMTTALLAAGAGTVVASVTRVGDEVALAAMTALHEGLASGVPAATALAGALRDLDAGFVCFGAG